jgi:hypothetical protein
MALVQILIDQNRKKKKKKIWDKEVESTAI